jgi:PPOX class probable F420-dependent enzyme
MPVYPQMPALTQEELVAFLNEATVARLGSMNEDGSIHLAAVYFKYENGEVLLGTQDVTQKVRNIRKNPQVSLLIDNHAPPWKGVMIYGQATLDYDNVIAKRAAIFERYMPPENAEQFATRLAKNYEPVVIRVKPSKLISYDYSKQGFIHQN